MTSFRQIHASLRERPNACTVAERLPDLFRPLLQAIFLPNKAIPNAGRRINGAAHEQPHGVHRNGSHRRLPRWRLDADRSHSTVALGRHRLGPSITC
jgi:hypothetical protein